MLKLFDKNSSIKADTRLLLIFFSVIAFIYISFNGNVHLFDWDEINFAEAAREMMVTGDYLNVRIDYEPFHEKPPLFIWMQLISMKLFGVSEFAARLPNAIAGIITLFVLINIGRKVYDKTFAYLWALAYFGSILPFFYFKSSIIDPVFNLFMFLGVYYLFNFTAYSIITGRNKVKDVIFAGLFTALAFLTKGPVGFLLVFMTWAVFWIFNTRKFKLPVKEILIFVLISFVPALVWYFLIFMQQGEGLIYEFISYQIRLLTTGDAGHEGPFYYHFVVVFFGCFPASIFALNSFRKNVADNMSQIAFKHFNIILLLVVLIIFSIVKTKILHYSSLAYFPVTFLAADYMYRLLKDEKRKHKTVTISTSVIGLILAIALTAFPIILMNIDVFLPQITDKLTNALLRADINWTGMEISSGIILIIGICLFVYFMMKRKFVKGITALFISTAFSIYFFMIFMAPVIENYTQNSAVEFFKSLSGKEVYVHTLGYKSYAPFYYQEKKYENSKYHLSMSGREYEEYLLFGKIDKDAYFSAKVNNYEDYIEKQPELEVLYENNGYIFLKRKKNKIKFDDV
ncbi:MAG: glycosyltransferase family 39 protein [Candidatus Kapabacteria bacterium]|jgi:4-amino-4-deoxy-L-arabinose transferase-like glycosyltransferase|nr:glycosyltransferase family 39 protein [Candidatus Kapabacteria bacterium]